MEEKNNKTELKEEKSTAKKEHKKGKKLIPIIVIIILLILVAGTIGGYYIIQNIEKNKSVGTTWGDTYYAYLKEASIEQDLGEREKYGIQPNMENTQIQFCDIEENEAPAMIMTYTKDDIEYVNTYKISNDNKVINVSYKEPSTIEFLYNIELQQYIWYVHLQMGTQDSYKPVLAGFEELDNENTTNTNNTNSINDNSISNITNSINVASNDVTKVEVTPEYTFEKDEATTVETVDGETLTISKFDETFVKPETELSQKANFDINSMDEKVIKDAIKTSVSGYKTEEQIVTEEVKANIDEKVTEVQTKQEEIKTAQEEKAKKEEEERKAEEARKAAEEAAKGLKVGNYRLKYGTYKLDSDMGTGLEGTIVLNQDGTFHIKTNFNQSSGDTEIYDEDGTYTVGKEYNSFELQDSISFKTKSGRSFGLYVVQNNRMNSQWHGYHYVGN